MSATLEAARDSTATNVTVRFGIGWVVAWVILVGVTWWTWATSTPWGPLPLPLLALLLAWIAVWIGSSGHPAPDRTMKVASYAVLAVATLAIVGASLAGLLLSSRMSATYAELEQAVHRTMMDGEGIPTSSCWPVTSDRDAAPVGQPSHRYDELDAGHLGDPDEVCHQAFDGARDPVRQVQFVWSTGQHRSLVYEAGTPHPSISQCVRHLEGPWWAWIEDSPNCPPGFDYIGA